MQVVFLIVLIYEWLKLPVSSLQKPETGIIYYVILKYRNPCKRCIFL